MSENSAAINEFIRKTVSQIHFVSRQYLDDLGLAGINIDAAASMHAKFFADEFCFRITASVLGKDLTPIEVPMSAWQHVKESIFPKWAKKIWPVRWKVYNIAALYPNAKYDHATFGKASIACLRTDLNKEKS